MRGKIHVLDPGVANRIAAGEVVERPASVVKELIENALDASAQWLELDLKGGGVELIRLRDDGDGMTEDDLTLCVLSHATSKIREVDDLFRIASFGFRGEALPSIASVSDIAIASRHRGSEIGRRISGRGGVMGPVEPAGGPVGTTVEVRNLFHNVPARRKFLKQERTELANCMEAVTRLLLPDQDAAIRVTHNGKLVLEVPEDADFRGRVATLFGKDLGRSLLEAGLADGSLRVEGLCGRPSDVRANGRLQYFFLNGRFIKDRSLAFALADAYRGLIMPKDYPVAFLKISMDPAEVDVNVHPTKTEVRFRDKDRVFSLVRRAVMDALGASSDLASLRLRAPSGSPAPAPAMGSARSAPASRAELLQHLERELFQEEAAGGSAEFSGRSLQPPPPPPDACSVRERPRAAATHPAVAQPSPSSGRFLQIHRSYILVETAEGLAIVDQHALHERKLFEDLVARFERAEGEDQPLLIPEVIDLGARDSSLILDHGKQLAEIGIVVEPFGGSSICVRSVPFLLSRMGPRELIEEVLAVLRGEGRRLDRTEFLREAAAGFACKAAVKFRDSLAEEEIRALLEWSERNPGARNCPHGRPVAIQVTLSELENQFQRKK